jgi:hypothetical protein
MRMTVLAALFALTTAACLRSSGSSEIDAPPNGSNHHLDASIDSNNHNDGGIDSMTDAHAGFQCKNKVTGVGSGHHNAGQDCNGACHDHGFTLAGTLYTTPTGSTAISGATITAIDAQGTTVNMVSQTNGNFYTTTPVTFPVTIYASECQISQTAQMMTATVPASSNGGCNSSGCHTTGAQGHIHLP